MGLTSWREVEKGSVRRRWTRMRTKGLSQAYPRPGKSGAIVYTAFKRAPTFLIGHGWLPGRISPKKIVHCCKRFLYFIFVFCVDAEDQNSDPPACTASALTNWAISPVPGRLTFALILNVWEIGILKAKLPCTLPSDTPNTCILLFALSRVPCSESVNNLRLHHLPWFLNMSEHVLWEQGHFVTQLPYRHESWRNSVLLKCCHLYRVHVPVLLAFLLVCLSSPGPRPSEAGSHCVTLAGPELIM